MALIRQNLLDKPGLIEKLADALDRAGAGEHAVALLTELAGSKDAHPCYLEWLADYHRRQGQADLAFAWQRRLFQQDLTLKSFNTLRQIGEDRGSGRRRAARPCRWRNRRKMSAC